MTEHISNKTRKAAQREAYRRAEGKRLPRHNRPARGDKARA